MARAFLLPLIVLMVLAGCQQAAPTPDPVPNPPPNPGGEPAVTAKGDMSTNYSDAALAVTTNDRSEVFVAGVQASSVGLGGVQPDLLRLFVNRYSKNAERLSWSRHLEDACPPKTACATRAAKLALDAEDNSWLLSEEQRVLEQTYGDDPGSWSNDAVLYKLSPEGSILWRKVLDEVDNSRPLGLSVASDGASYVLWQAIGENLQDGYLGVRLSKFSATGTVLWARAIETPLSYEETLTLGRHLDIADVALLGEAVVVVGLANVQAFDAEGEPLWQRALEYTPLGGALPELEERYYTQVEAVASGSQLYLGRNSELLRTDMGFAAEMRLELTSLSGTGEVLWTETLGDEQFYVSGTNLSATEPYGLFVAGIVSPQQENTFIPASNFVTTINPQGQGSPHEVNPPEATVQVIQGPKGQENIVFLAGATYGTNELYDTPEFTAPDAFLAVGNEGIKN